VSVKKYLNPFCYCSEGGSVHIVRLVLAYLRNKHKVDTPEATISFILVTDEASKLRFLLYNGTVVGLRPCYYYEVGGVKGTVCYGSDAYLDSVFEEIAGVCEVKDLEAYLERNKNYSDLKPICLVKVEVPDLDI